MPAEPTRPVTLSDDTADAHTAELGKAAHLATDRLPSAALDLAAAWTPRLPLPGHGRTRELWEALATVAAADLSVARILEPHLDAVAILAESGDAAPPATTWGVYAAEGPGVRLTATPTDPADPAGPAAGWQLTGTKPWCSLAGEVSHALVTAWVGEERALFRADLRHDGVRVLPGRWHSHGLAAVPSGPVEMTRVPASPVGEPGWYLRRDGFAWGGIGVAAVWYGGAVGVARRVWAAAGSRTPDQVALVHLGRVDAALHTARTALAEAAAAVDGGRANGSAGALLASRVRQVVAVAAETVVAETGHALGPAPLALEAEHAQRVADLTVYVRQHHADRDAAALGRALLDAGGAPW